MSMALVKMEILIPGVSIFSHSSQETRLGLSHGSYETERLSLWRPGDKTKALSWKSEEYIQTWVNYAPII